LHLNSGQSLQRVFGFLEDMHMIRLTLALAAWMSLLPAVWAFSPSRQESPWLSPKAAQALPRLAAKAPEQQTKKPANTDFVMTAQTEVLLNGQPCRYEQVPAHATIIRMEVDQDEKTVLMIHFRTRK
jgi:hypothetical protein